MEKLPDSVLLEILSRLDNSADVARCRVAYKAFNTVFPGIRSISLRSSPEWYSRVSNSQRMIQPLQTVFLNLISKLETVESVRLILLSPFGLGCKGEDDGTLTEGDFPKEWLPRVSGSLKSLSICDALKGPFNPSTIVFHISAYCYNLVSLRLSCLWLSLDNVIPMPMLTKLTLESIISVDEDLDELNKCFPNLQTFELFAVGGLEHLMVDHLNLKTFIWDNWEDGDVVPSLTLITPNLTTLEVVSCKIALIHVEAPLLSHFKLRLNGREHACGLTIGKKFENLKTLCLQSSFIGSLLSQFPVIKTVENLTLDSEDDFPDSEDSDSENEAPRDAANSEENLPSDSENAAPRDATDSEFTLGKVFTFFPNARSLCINSKAWSELEFGWNTEGWEVSDGRKGWKTICAYLKVVDPLADCFLASVLDQFVSLSEVSLLIHGDVEATLVEWFMSRCMARWPRIRWRWGIWNDFKKDRWITDDIYPHKSSKKSRL